MIDTPAPRSSVIKCRGAIATERRLLDAIDAALEERTDLASPIRIIVPSKSLRHHVLQRLVRHRGAVAGVIVQTAFGAAREVLRRADLVIAPGDAFFEIVVRRLARQQSSLASHLERLEDGYGAVVGVVRDLLDAGFQPGNEEGVLDRLDDLERPIAHTRKERAQAVVWVAARTYEAMHETGAWRSAQAFEAADEVLRRQGEDALPASTVVVHGFADVTGLVADFLTALARVHTTVFLLDRPCRPGGAGRPEPGLVFLERFQSRLSHLDQEHDVGESEVPEILVTQAGDVEAEARWVAERVKALMAGGVRPEAIGVVGRVLDGMAPSLRRHFRRLGVPFSGVGSVLPGGGAQREVQRLINFFDNGPATSVDACVEWWVPPTVRADLTLGMRQLGLQRLADLAAFRDDWLEERGVKLPFDLRLDPDPRRRRAYLPADAVRAAVRHARALVRELDGWSLQAPPADHAERSLSLLESFGWSSDAEARRGVEEMIVELADELAVFDEVERGEWLRMLGERTAGLGEVPIGGEGGGVQVLTVVEARSRTFEHLFVVAFNRGVFPRVAPDDALLPDVVRARLAVDVLPEMPVRARSSDEERYLFAQLLSGAPHVHLSWHTSAVDSRMSRSPYVSDLVPAGSPDPVAPGLWSPARADLGPRSPYEHAVTAAPQTDRNTLADILAVALDDGLTVAASELASARIDVLDQVDPPKKALVPNPWFGFVGPVLAPGPDGLAVTTLEKYGACPFQAFVTRRLGVFPTPDPQTGLPDPAGRLVGNVVHNVLEEIVLAAFDVPPGPALADIANGETRRVPWPDHERFESIVLNVARRVAREEGLEARGMTRLLAARARPFLEPARSFEWKDGTALADVLAAEVEGAVEIEGIDTRLKFRADRVDRGHGGLVLVDYKTGNLISDRKKLSTRAQHLRDKVAAGRTLQAAVYAHAAADGSARGRYLWLKPDLKGAPKEARESVVEGSDAATAAVLADAVGTIVDMHRLGAVFPRVEEVGSEKLPTHCRYCPVAETCRRDDTGFRRRLVAWMDASDDHAADDQAAARRLWHLGHATGGGQ